MVLVPAEDAKSDVRTKPYHEEQLSWASGSTLLRTQNAESSCHRKFVRDDLAIGIIIAEDPGSEVIWNIDGHLRLDKVWSQTVNSHDLLVVPPGCELESRCRGAGQGMWLFLDPQTIADDERAKAFARDITVDYSWSKDRLLWTIITEIKKECTNGFPRGPMFLERAAMIFLTQLAYFLGGPPSQLDSIRALSHEKLRQVIDYFESNLNRNITLSEVSDLVALTPRYFCAAFKEAVGRPPHQFQIERRVERAKGLLSNPNLSLVDIALMVGFSSQSHLSDCFRRIMGITPARYRAEMRGKTKSDTAVESLEQ
ncbi:MAG TPA: AraC family transcriptional regulator [Methylovirgula sp.]|nr:AraC family transcriptional regulator [Methylovirgula sp.]